MNAQTVIVGKDRSGSVWTPLQLRSPVKKMMPWHLSAIGGRKDPEDKTPYDTARRGAFWRSRESFPTNYESSVAEENACGFGG